MAGKSKRQTSKLSKVTESQVQKLATTKSFDRGRSYYQNGAITDPTRQDNRIWADCYGTEIYQPRATLTSKGISESNCTCPYDWGGICKHQVALLLTYVHEPTSFRVIPPLREMLADYSRDDLFNLIDRILQQQPDLITSLEVAAELNIPHETGKPIDTSSIRRQIQRALRGDDMWTIVNQIGPAFKMAEQIYAAQDYFNAGRFYALILTEITEKYDGELQSIDYDGYVAGCTQDAAEGVHNCLIAGDIDPGTRAAWFAILLDSLFKEIELGGVDFAAGADDALIDQTTDAEWATIEAQIRQKITQGVGRWGRDALTGIITSRLEHRGQHDAAVETGLELSSPESKVFILVERGEYGLAIDLAKQHLSHYRGLVPQFVEALIAANQEKAALQYMRELAHKTNDYAYRQWLGKYYCEQGDDKTAWEFEAENFMQYPSLEQYKILEDLARAIGTWDKHRRNLLKHLRDKKQWQTLLDIALHEKDLAQALKCRDGCD